MIQDPTDPQTVPEAAATEPGSAPQARPQVQSGLQAPPDVEPDQADDEDEAALPNEADDIADAVVEGEVLEGTMAIGRSAIAKAVRLAPTSPGVYRMLNAANDVLYVGKAKNVKKRLASYARPTGQVMRIARMIAATSV